MPEFFCNKIRTATSYALVPAHQQDLDTIKKLPVGKPMRCKVTQIRNVDHHRKYFALLNYAYDCWEPPEEFLQTLAGKQIGLVPEKNFERFRKDITILCGFYESSFRINGEVRLEAKSISFAAMNQDEFDKLYDTTITVICKHVMKNYDDDQLKEIIDQVMEFDG